MTKASLNDTDNNTNHTIDGEIINLEQFEDMRDLLEEDFSELVQTYLTDSQAAYYHFTRSSSCQ